MSGPAGSGKGAPQTWYFTFGQAHEHGRRYVVFRGLTYADARARMVELYGLEWAFQYDEAQWTKPDGRTQAEHYGLEELADLPDPAEVQSIDDAAADHVVEWHGLLVTFGDAAALSRDAFLYGSLFLTDSGREHDGRRVLRRIDPTTVTIANPTERSTK